MLRPNSLTELEGLTTDQILARSKDLDFKVEPRKLVMSPKPPGEIAMRSQGIALEDYRAIVRADTHKVFHIATKDYKIHQNRAIVDFMREFADAGGGKLVQVGTFKGGAVLYAMVKLATGGTNVPGGSKLEAYAMVATSHDGSIATRVKPTSVYVVCWNTFMRALAEKVSRAFSLRHTSEWTAERAKEARAVLVNVAEQVQEVNEAAVTLAKVTGFDEKAQEEYISRLLNGESLLQQAVANTEATVDHGALLDKIVALEEAKQEKDPLGRVGRKILQAIVESPGSELPASKNTLWGAFNGVTFFADHKRSGEATRGFSSQFGEGDRLKAKAFDLAMQMAREGA